MSEPSKRLDIKRLEYFVNLYAEKVDLGTKYFMMRVNALMKKDKEQVEFIENMYLKPADLQAEYAAKKIKQLFD